MITEKEILEYTQENYPNECDLIARTLINYYTLKNKDDKTDKDELHQEKLYDGVLELFEVLSRTLAEEMDGDSDQIYESLKSIHIKT